MKIVFVGDFRNLPNWGCRSTGSALADLLSPPHEIIDRIAPEALVNSGWDKYAGPGIRYGSFFPRDSFNWFWPRRDLLRRPFRLYKELDKWTGARFDFVALSAFDSVKRFHLARLENERLQEIYELIMDCDAVIFNGEGTMIFSNPARRDVLFNNFLMALASECGKKFFFLNAMFTECPYTGLDERTASETVRLLEGSSGVACRERQSYDFVRSRSSNVPLTTISDALFSWKERVINSIPHVTKIADAIQPFGHEWLRGKFDFCSPYVCISGTSSAYRVDHGRAAVRAYSAMVRELSKLGLKMYLVQTCSGDAFLDEVGGMTGISVVPYQAPVLAGAAILANARLLVSGRFHPSIMASLGGAPCVFLGANSHKTFTLQHVLQYGQVHSFADIPADDELKEIYQLAEDFVLQGDELRSKISHTVDMRSRQARKVGEFVGGRMLEPML